MFPILLYNGNKKWTAAENINDLIIQSVPAKYIPNFSYYQIIENIIPTELLLKIKNTVSAIFYVENSSPEELRENFHKVLGLIEKEQPEIITLFRNWLNNLFGNIDNELNEKIEDLLEVKEMFETALKKQQKEWLQQGMEKGIEKGERIEKQNILIKLLSKKFGINDEDEKIIKDTEDTAKLDRAIEEVLFAKTKEDVLSCLS